MLPEVVVDEVDMVLERVNQQHLNTAAAAIEIGKELLWAKSQVKHGTWKQRLALKAPDLSLRQAQKYMRLAQFEEEAITSGETTIEGAINAISKAPLTALLETHVTSSLPAITSAPVPNKGGQQPISEYAAKKMLKETLLMFKNRSKVMNMHIRNFLTIEEDVGRDLTEAIQNIDMFDSQEDLDQLHKMLEHCKQLAKRAAEMASNLEVALRKKERII
jgi:hypothetical protein